MRPNSALPKVLIVDDETYNVDYLEQELEDLNYTILSATSGQQALTIVKDESPDLVLLDIMMPGMDGFEVLQVLKSEPESRNIPVIIISAANDMRSVIKGIQLGAEDYLPKPFEPALLKARISSSLEKKHLRDVEQLYLQALQKEMAIASDIQAGFLPSEIPGTEGWDLAVYFKAAMEVAGDFYDAFLLPDGSLVCFIGDVCGKGVGAALFMTLFRSLLRVTSTTDSFCEIAGSAAPKPVDRLRHAVEFTNNYVAIVHGDANMFATIFIGIFNQEQGKFAYLNCGNEPPILIRSGSKDVIRLGPTGPCIGIIEDASFTVEEMELAKDDVLIAFTDGLPDAFNDDNSQYGQEPIINRVTNLPPNADILCNAISEDVQKFIGNAGQFDDITLMVIKHTN